MDSIGAVDDTEDIDIAVGVVETEISEVYGGHSRINDNGSISRRL